MPIIRSLLDTDLYKYTMMQIVHHQFADAEVSYRYRCRNAAADLRPIVDDLGREIEALAELRLQPEELDYLAGLRFIKRDFVDSLKDFRFNPDHIDLAGLTDPERDFIRGPWLHTILFEVPLLAIITELHQRRHGLDFAEGERRLAAKIAFVAETPEDFRVSEFGTRRRASRDWHERLLTRLRDGMRQHLFGTSNVDLARRLGLVPIGTMAHEYLQACQVLSGDLRNFQKFAFEAWAREYRGDLGIALTDTIGMDAFLSDFDMYFCKLFDGVRHDSGDPIAWGERMIAHYRANRVNPACKALMFSDALDLPRALQIHRHFAGRIQTGFGIGTDLTNDLGQPRLDSVIKMTSCNGRPVAKVSDAPGKSMCPDPQFDAYLRGLFGKQAGAAASA